MFLLKRVVLALFLLCIGFSSAEAAPLRIGVMPVIDTLPLQIAMQEKLFDAAGVDVELVSFDSALERDTALRSGRLDGYFSDLISVVLLADRGIDLRIVAIPSYTTKGQRLFAWMSAPKLQKEPSNIALSTVSIIEYLFDGMSRMSGKGQDIERIEIKKLPVRLQMLLSGQVESALIPEPLASLAEKRGAKVIMTDENLGEPLTVLCLTKDHLDKKDAFLKGYAAAHELYAKNPEAWRKLMVKSCRIPDVLAEEYPMQKFNPAPMLSREELHTIQTWMIAKGMIAKEVPYERFLAE